jgi:hypothetical protein
LSPLFKRTILPSSCWPPTSFTFSTKGANKSAPAAR